MRNLPDMPPLPVTIRPTPREAAIKVLRKFGKLVMPVHPHGLNLKGTLTNRYGNAETDLTFRYVRSANAEDWIRQKKYLQLIGIAVPETVPFGFELWEMVEVLDALPAQPDQTEKKIASTVNSDSPDFEKEEGGAE